MGEHTRRRPRWRWFRAGTGGSVRAAGGGAHSGDSLPHPDEARQDPESAPALVFGDGLWRPEWRYGAASGGLVVSLSPLG